MSKPEDKNFWETSEEEVDNLKMGTSYPPIKVYISAMQIAKLNSLEPVVKSIILSDGKEMDLEMYLETDRNTFAKEMREAIDE